MITGQTQKHPEWRVIVDMVRAVEWGELVTHAMIADATSLKPETMVYYRHIRQARTVLLRDHRIILDTEPKAGYRRTHPDGMGQSAQQDARIGRRRLKRSASKFGVAVENAHLLTIPDRVRSLEQQMLQMRVHVQALGKSIRSMKNVLAPVQARKVLTDGHDEANQQPH